MQGLLSVLRPEQERAVVLHHVIGLEVSEVAEHQGVPTETARSRLRLGMQKLRHRARVREIAQPQRRGASSGRHCLGIMRGFLRPRSAPGQPRSTKTGKW
ncbi:MAG: sigma factor-like helix-turn-helix DNA-binding protein [Myxococcales bacterium]